MPTGCHSLLSRKSSPTRVHAHSCVPNISKFEPRPCLYRDLIRLACRTPPQCPPLLVLYFPHPLPYAALEAPDAGACARPAGGSLQYRTPGRPRLRAEGHRAAGPAAQQAAGVVCGGGGAAWCAPIAISMAFIPQARPLPPQNAPQAPQKANRLGCLRWKGGGQTQPSAMITAQLLCQAAF